MIENLAASLRLLLVTDDQLLAGHDPVGLCTAAVQGGVTAIQLRLKHSSDRDLLALARELRGRLDVPLFVNDRLDVALAAGADGVHLGIDDISPAMARRVVPDGFVIGASVGSEGEIERAEAADYWGIGPLRKTTTKGDAGDPLGWASASRLRARAGARPCVIIGGVVDGDVTEARTAGFSGVAVSRAILGAADVRAAASDFLWPAD